MEFKSLYDFLGKAAGRELGLEVAKAALRDAGYYYQFPSGFDGQSPNTGAGSDV